MGKPSIKRLSFREARLSRRLLRGDALVSVSIAIDVKTGKPLLAGRDHAALAEKLASEFPEGSWEITEVRFWR